MLLPHQALGKFSQSSYTSIYLSPISIILPLIRQVNAVCSGDTANSIRTWIKIINVWPRRALVDKLKKAQFCTHAECNERATTITILLDFNNIHHNNKRNNATNPKFMWFFSSSSNLHSHCTFTHSPPSYCKFLFSSKLTSADACKKYGCK